MQYTLAQKIISAFIIGNRKVIIVYIILHRLKPITRSCNIIQSNVKGEKTIKGKGRKMDLDRSSTELTGP